jgi:dynein heavy chain
MVTLKIMVVGGQLVSNDVSIFLKAGSALDKNSERQNPFRWMADKIWLNILALTRHALLGKAHLPAESVLKRPLVPTLLLGS